MEISDRAQVLIERLNKNGERAYIVGGCVRDLIMGKEPSDWDITTSATPERTMEIFSDLTTIPTGIAHGTVTVVYEGEPFEITTFRSDGEYKDHRRPSEVSFVKSLEEDLARRDFTMNAIAFSRDEGLVDPFGGHSDIKNRIIRAVGDPEKRFSEDALRIMRALRFAARLGFTIEDKTSLAAHKLSKTLQSIAKERVTDEFLKLICASFAEQVLLKNINVLESVFKGSLCIEGISKMPQNEIVRLSYIFKNSAENLRVLRLSRNMSARVNRILNYEFKDMRHLVGELGEDALNFLAFIGASDEETDKCRDIIKNNVCCTISQLEISGKDLTELGISGKKVGEIISRLLEEVIRDAIPNEYNALIIKAQELF